MLQLDVHYQHAHCHLTVQLNTAAQVIGILGRSGVGKTTLLDCIAGFKTPQYGFMSHNDQILFDHQQRINLPIHQRRVGLLSQTPYLFSHLTALDNINYSLRWQKRSHSDVIRQHLVDQLQLSDLMYRYPQQLSGGQAQRVALARTLMAQPDLLLLDEPSTGLDQTLRQLMLSLIKQFAEQPNHRVIYVTHHPEELIQLNAEVYCLDQGVLCSAKTIQTDPSTTGRLDDI